MNALYLYISENPFQVSSTQHPESVTIMIEYFEAICRALLQPRSTAGILPILDPTDQFNIVTDDTAALAAKLNAGG